ncbi:MAG TPA: hypothetical protein GXX51_10830 [Firmicutes bacterium]|nr:hypothetical protein [Bacillota bacterium]
MSRGRLQLDPARSLIIVLLTLALALFLFILFGTYLGGLSAAQGQARVVMDMDDPEGDDHGPGSYVYPLHKAFQHDGLFDLLHFTVSYDSEYVYFDSTFKEITNPWNAPEGFSHQLINIYIDSISGEGKTQTLKPGAQVVFDKRYAWDFQVKVLGWGGSRVFTARDTAESKGISDGVRAEVLPQSKTIRVAVPRAILGEPTPRWRYYVLVGSQDAFGIDDYRQVMEKPGNWVFGGGSDLDFDPNVIDMLAPGGGRYSQEAMLGSYNVARGTLATIHPVSESTVSGGMGVASAAAALAVAAALAIFIWWRRRRAI